MRPRTRAEVARALVGHLGLRAPVAPTGLAGARRVLEDLRCIQLDPLDRIGTNADLVVAARADGTRRGDVFRLPNDVAFEHFAKERCLLPARVFPAWRDAASVETSWWRLSERHTKLAPEVVARVKAEVEASGPLACDDLADHGRVEPMDWSGWKGTSKAATLAMEVLWTTCDVVTAGRDGRRRRYDVPRRALPTWSAAPGPGDFHRFALLERVEACGLLPTATGPQWSMLREARTGPLVDALIAEGLLQRVAIEGTTRTWLAPIDLFDRVHPEDDGRMRILGPLDPLLWDRELVRVVFGFDYVWEVYKPAATRTWGYYVVPLLHEGRLVGRFEGHLEAGEVVIDRRWVEDGVKLDEGALRDALERHPR